MTFKQILGSFACSLIIVNIASAQPAGLEWLSVNGGLNPDGTVEYSEKGNNANRTITYLGRRIQNSPEIGTLGEVVGNKWQAATIQERSRMPDMRFSDKYDVLVANGETVVNWQIIDRRAVFKTSNSSSVVLPNALTMESGRSGRPARVKVSENEWQAAYYFPEDDVVQLIRDPRTGTDRGPDLSQKPVQLLFSTPVNHGAWNDDWDGGIIRSTAIGDRILYVLESQNRPHSWKSAEFKVKNGAFSVTFFTDELGKTKDLKAGTITAMPEKAGTVLRFSNDFTWTRRFEN
ncbi:hypothetical protein [Rubinisphaera italica]|nr:hypothetical protein [Rubinisphaera italica]